MRDQTSLALAALMLLSACGDDTPSGTPTDTTEVADTTADIAPDTAPEAELPPTPIAFCEGATTFPWDPDDGGFLAAFPDDALTVDDAAALTGQRVARPAVVEPLQRLAVGSFGQQRPLEVAGGGNLAEETGAEKLHA